MEERCQNTSSTPCLLTPLKEAKFMGFSDQQPLIMQDGTDEKIYEMRKAAGITRVYKMVDTCSAEFEAKHSQFALL